ncbi:MAG: serine hydrolase [Bacteroidetes bacterium]|nr:serine hydrolase [Bacteroidota bacterium]
MSVKKNLVSLVILTVFSSCLFAQLPKIINTQQVPGISKNDTGLVYGILKSNPAYFKEILNNPAGYGVQVIYTQIDRDSLNIPSLKRYYYGPVNREFFYPASLVKLPCSLLAIEKINSLNDKGLTLNTVMLTDSTNACQKKVYIDPTAVNDKPSVANYLKRMLLVSDNEAYNRIYEFLGQEYIHNTLNSKGYSSTRILNRFDADCSLELNRFTNRVSFFDSTGKLLYIKDAQENKMKYDPPLGQVKKGRGYLDRNDKYVNGPKDFTYSNYLSLSDVNEMLQSVIFPGSVNEKKRFELTESDRMLLLKNMSMYPRESAGPLYNKEKYFDSFKKYFIYGRNNKSRVSSDTLRIFNVVGQSYGYLSDCAYIVDYKNKIEFMLSAVIYVNKDGVINDNKYEYKEIGFPFLLDLSKAIYTFEKGRMRQYEPRLDELKITR